MTSTAETIDQSLRHLFKSSPKTVFLTSAKNNSESLTQIVNELATNAKLNRQDTLIIRSSSQSESNSINSFLQTLLQQPLEPLDLNAFGLVDFCHVVHLQSRSIRLVLTFSNKDVCELYFYDGILFQIHLPNKTLVTANTQDQEHNQFLLRSIISELCKLNISSYSIVPVTTPNKSFKTFLKNQITHYALTDMPLRETGYFLTTLKSNLVSNALTGHTLHLDESSKTSKAQLRLFSLMNQAFDRVILQTSNHKNPLIRGCQTCVVVIDQGDRAHSVRRHIKRILRHNIPVAGTIFAQKPSEPS